MSHEVRGFYNRYGEREWERLEADAVSRITFALHMDFVRPHLREGVRILDAGCGAGRCSVEFARMGCDVTLFDISDEQLRIAKSKLAERGWKGRSPVTSRETSGTYLCFQICRLTLWSATAHL